MASPNEAPKIKTFLMAKQSFLNALQNAKRCSLRFKKERSEELDEHDEALLHFIKKVVQRFPKDAEGISRTREKLVSRTDRRNIIKRRTTVASSTVALIAPTALATAEPSNVLPAILLNTTVPTPLSPPSSPAPAPALTPHTPTGACRPIPDAIEVIVPQAAPITPTTAPVYTSLSEVIVNPSATGLGTRTIWLDTADPASGQAETETTMERDTVLHNLSNTAVPPSGRRVVVRDPRSSSLCNNGSSANSRLTRSQKFRTRHRSPTPYPMATRPVPPPPTRKPERPESQKSKKRSRDVDSDDEATRPRKRRSQESLASTLPSLATSGTPLSTQGSPVPSRSERRGRSSKRGKGKDNLMDN